MQAWMRGTTAPAAPTLYARSSNTVLRNMSLGSVPNAPCFVRAAWARGNSNSATPPPAVAAAACEPQIKQGTSTRARSPHGTAPDSTPRERAHTMAAHHNAALACRTQQRGPVRQAPRECRRSMAARAGLAQPYRDSRCPRCERRRCAHRSDSTCRAPPTSNGRPVSTGSACSLAAVQAFVLARPCAQAALISDFYLRRGRGPLHDS